MPHRLVSAAILVLWLVAAVALFRKDVLPQWIVGPPPDLRTISQAGEDPTPVRWSILLGDAAHKDSFRPVGKIVSKSAHRRDGSVQWVSEATIDAAEFAGKTRLAIPGMPLRGTRPMPESGWTNNDLLRVSSLVEIDPVGNLFHMRASVRSEGETEDILSLEGHVQQNELVITTNSPLPLLRSSPRHLPYRARGMVENPLSPIDRMPGLRIGQRWSSQMANPLTGGAQEVYCEVVGNEMLHWGGTLSKTLVVVTKVPPLSFRTWVRPEDGLVLRQEVPYPLAPLLLERQVPETAQPAGPTP